MSFLLCNLPFHRWNPEGRRPGGLGSDAIAGVVDIVLRTNFEGARIRTTYKEAQHFSDDRKRNVSAIAGYGDIDKQGCDTCLAVEGYKRDGYSSGDLRAHYPRGTA